MARRYAASANWGIALFDSVAAAAPSGVVPARGAIDRRRNSYDVYYYQNGKQQTTMRVVVGTPETQTPMLAGMVRYAILNPYRNVPPDLVAKRIAPKVLAGASNASLRYQALADWSVASLPHEPSTIDWHAVVAGDQEVRIRQLPGAPMGGGR